MPKYFVQFIYITAEIVRVKFVKFIGVKCHLKKKEEFDDVVFPLETLPVSKFTVMPWWNSVRRKNINNWQPLPTHGKFRYFFLNYRGSETWEHYVWLECIYHLSSSKKICLFWTTWSHIFLTYIICSKTSKNSFILATDTCWCSVFTSYETQLHGYQRDFTEIESCRYAIFRDKMRQSTSRRKRSHVDQIKKKVDESKKMVWPQ